MLSSWLLYLNQGILYNYIMQSVPDQSYCSFNNPGAGIRNSVY